MNRLVDNGWMKVFLLTQEVPKVLDQYVLCISCHFLGMEWVVRFDSTRLDSMLNMDTL